jgi:WD40 repeat protein
VPSEKFQSIGKTINTAHKNLSHRIDQTLKGDSVPQTFRVFISSTFSDFVAERNALQRNVFPRLRQFVAGHGWRFQPIDLRWGVNEEASLDQRAMPICLEELRRCQQVSPRPNFLILLGDRYGWQPLPYTIAVTEFEIFLGLADDEERNLLRQWYQRDDNSVTAAYVLLPRKDEYVDYTSWEFVERKLHAFFATHCKSLGGTDNFASYKASATEQEILAGALQVEDAQEHVLCCLREIKDLPESLPDSSFFDVLPDGRIDLQASQRLTELKEQLHQQLGEKIYRYQTSWQVDHLDSDYIEDFCTEVYARLENLFLQQINSVQEIESLEREIRAHTSFQQQRSLTFVGRQNYLQQIEEYLDRPDEIPLTHGEHGMDHETIQGVPLVFVGAGGSGKSALLAKAIADAQQAISSKQIVYRFIGATPNSVNLHSLLADLYRQIAGLLEQSASPPKDLKELIEEFENLLKQATPERPLVLFLDALDQLSPIDGAHNLNWLPKELPDHVYLVVSILDGPVAESCQRIFPATQIVRIDALSADEGEELLDQWLEQVGRTLQPHQKQSILSSFKQSGLPLYLKLAFEESRRWSSWQQPYAFQESIDGIITDLFVRLEKEHGSLLVQRSLGYLAASKHGLTEDEMLDLLSSDVELFQDFLKTIYHDLPERKLPIVPWLRLYEDLAPYLIERQAGGTSLMAFFHRQFGEVALKAYLDDDIKTVRHQHIADYFERQPLVSMNTGLNNPNARKTAELPYQYAKSKQEQKLENLLIGFDFAMAKCAADQLEDYREDYDIAKKVIVAPGRDYRIWESFVRSNMHILRRGDDDWPAYKILLQLAIEHAGNSPLTIGAERFLAEDKCNWTWLRRERRLSEVAIDPVVRVFEGHTDSVGGARVLADGRILSWSDDKTLRIWDSNSGKCLTVLEGHTNRVNGTLILNEGRFLSWSEDKSLRLWDNNSGQCLAILEGHSMRVNGALVLSDGRILSWSGDNSLRTWDSKSGECLSILNGHFKGVDGVLVLSDGRILSWSSDDTLRIWAGESGHCLKTLERPRDDFNGQVDELGKNRGKIAGVLKLSDNRMLVWFSISKPLLVNVKNDKWSAVTSGNEEYDYAKDALALSDGLILFRSLLYLWTWDSTTGKRLTVIKHNDSYDWIHGLDLSDGRVLSWSDDKILRIWDSKNGESLTVMEGHTERVVDVLALSDSRILSWSDDKTLRIWDSNSGKCLTVLEGHANRMNGALVLSEGRILSWSQDGTLRVLVCNTVYYQTTLERHTGTVNGTLILNEGRFLSWSDDNSLRTWDSKSGECLSVLEGHVKWVKGALTLDDGRILSWSGDDSLRIWDSNSGECLSVLELPGVALSGVKGALILDNELIFIVFEFHGKCSLRILDISNGQVFASLKGHSGDVHDAIVLDDGRIFTVCTEYFIVWSSEGKLLEKYDNELETEADLFRLPIHVRKAVLAVAESGWWLNDETEGINYLDYSKQIKIYITQNGNASAVIWQPFYSSTSRHLFEDGRVVVTQNDGQVCLLKVYQGKEVVVPESLSLEVD